LWRLLQQAWVLLVMVVVLMLQQQRLRWQL
jgi:hypothetical protein